jgi:hypothetical protein
MMMAMGQMREAPQDRCSLNNRTSKFNDRAGVNSASRCTRNSCAGLNVMRRPSPRCDGTRRLINSSGTKADNCSSSSLVPVRAKGDFMPGIFTPLATVRPPQSLPSVFWALSPSNKMN